MMRNIIIIILTFSFSFGQGLNAQNISTFYIDSLSKPKNLLFKKAPESLFNDLSIKVQKSSFTNDSLVNFDQHSFLNGVISAYADHRPFTISPDMVWLLISQGFARHITFNAEKYRDSFIKFDKKKTLTVVAKDIDIDDPKSKWEDVFPQFASSIKDYVGDSVVEILTPNFSTTTRTSMIASQITLMETFRSYFDYYVIRMSCGIPLITIEGTAEDWEKVLFKIKAISKYDLKWWTNELEPIVIECINAKRGNFNREFWKNMVQTKTEGPCYPTYINGWVLKLFPYNTNGSKSNFKQIFLNKADDLASEIIKVPFNFWDQRKNKNVQMEFWSGFVGLKQNNSDFTLRPEIGWMVNKKEGTNRDFSNMSFEEEIDNLSFYKIDAVPEIIHTVKKIHTLHLQFNNEILINNELSGINIDVLELDGIISDKELLILKNRFKNTVVKLIKH